MLQDAHDAQDTFQAVFLVLANKARSIRRQDSVASWLFGVAQRVAARARNRAARRRSIDQKAAERLSECYIPPEHDPDQEVVHEELDRLPERLRAPLVLCYLEGLTYDAAAQHLDLSEGTLRGRLSQARNRLRTRLTRRGVAVPAALLAAGASAQAKAAVPEELLRSTIQIAHGLTAGNSAAALARGVLNAMLLKQFKVVAGLLLIGTATCFTAGLAWALGPRAQIPAVEPQVAAPAARSAEDTAKTGRRDAQVHGVVVDEAGQPVAGADVFAYPFTEREARYVTDQAGLFVIPMRGGKPAGMRVLARTASADRSGFSRYDHNAMRKDTDSPTRIVLKPTREIIVHASDSSRGPVAGAAVEVTGDFFVYAGATTGADGNARLRVPAEAKVNWVLALKSGLGFDYAEYGSIDDQGRAGPGVPAPELPASVSLTLDGAQTVRIKAVDRDGKPLAGVKFAPWLLRKEGRRSYVNVGSLIKNRTTERDGVATFDWLPTYKSSLTFWSRSDGYANRRVDVEEGTSATITARLMKTESIRGRVVYPDGQPAAGIEVHAFGSGQGLDNGRGQAQTSEDGSYEMSVNPREVYAVYVDDKAWAAPSHLDVIVREGKPVAGVDFKLSRGTLIRGTVVVDPAKKPVANQYITIDESGGPAPDEFREKGDHFGHVARRQFGAMTDSHGRYSILVGPGTYTLMGPPRTENEQITVKAELEVVRDFRMPRPEKGILTGRVVLPGAETKGVALARIEIVPENQRSVPISVTADSEGRFRAERQLDPLVICATTPDGIRATIVEVGAEDTTVIIPLAPTATASGTLVDERAQPVANTRLYWGRRVFLDEERRLSTICFGTPVVTDSAGRFSLRSLVVGQEYEIGIRRENVFPTAGAVRPEKAEPTDLGTLQLGAYHPKSPAYAEEMSSFTRKAPGPGAVAPPIEATTLDGKPLKLADYKGKYVLLDFWATWCGPCIAEIPQLHTVHDAFAKDGKFAILSLSVDEKIDEPKKFQEKRNLPWTQAFLGGGIHGPTPGTFGVRAIPAFVLVGPDGKIVARGMRGDDIKKEVEKALQSHALPVK
jgi:RNA polymerase sigma factor (sigma-70 family)